MQTKKPSKTKYLISLEKKLFIRGLNQERDAEGNVSGEVIFDKLEKYPLLKNSLVSLTPAFVGGGKVMNIIGQINDVLKGK